MDSVKHEEVTIIDKDNTSNTVCHVVDGFLLEESNEPFPVSPYMFGFSNVLLFLFIPVCTHMQIIIVYIYIRYFYFLKMVD